jgi:6-phosphogluconolactonase (cycloisomerase 2 family)
MSARWKCIVVGGLVVGLSCGVPVTRAWAADPAPLRTVADPNPNFHSVWVDTLNNEVIVTDDNTHAVMVYSRTASGPALPLRVIQGLSTGLDFPSSTVVDTVNNEVWANMNDTSDRSTVYPRTAVGNAVPLRILDHKALTPERRAYGLAVDTVNNEVAVAIQRGPAVVVYNRVTVGVLRTLKGPTTTMADPHGIAVDTINNEIIVSNEGHVFGAPPRDPSITVFTRLAAGDTAPLRTIQGPLTGLSAPKNISLDTTNNEIAVANGFPANSITIYSRTATGNVAPLRTIQGTLTGLSNPSGVFIDAVNNELFVANWGNHSLTVYSRTATGNVAPLRTLTNAPLGSAQVGIGNPGALSLDLTNNEFAVTNCVSHPRIAFFTRLANGAVAPTRVIEGTNTRLSRSMHGVAIDSVNNEVWVPSTMEDAALVFSRTASGDVAPLRVIQGPLTQINKAQGIAVDPVNNEIAVVNEAALTITIYSRTATGNVAPLRVISDSTATFVKPVGIWIDTVNNEIVVSDEDTPALVFPRLANGPTVPLRMIDVTSFIKARQLTVDTTNNEILVVSQGDRSIDPPLLGGLEVWDRLANTGVPPRRFIQGPISGVRHPRSLFVDPTNNEVAVGDSKYNDIRVFPRLF